MASRYRLLVTGVFGTKIKTRRNPSYKTIIENLDKALTAFDKSKQESQSTTTTIKNCSHKAEDALSSLHDDLISVKGGFYSIVHSNAVSRYFNPDLAKSVDNYKNGNERAMRNVVTLVSTPLTRE